MGLAISLSDAILKIEKFLSPQITIASSSNKYLLLSCLCKQRFTDKVNIYLLLLKVIKIADYETGYITLFITLKETSDSSFFL